MKVTKDSIGYISSMTDGSNEKPQGLISNVKNLYELVAGDKFLATVLDIKPNNVRLSLDSGYELKAKSLELPNIHIGDSAVFSVKENVKGQIFIEMMKPEVSQSGISESLIRGALANAGLPFTESNKNMIELLIAANLPIDEKTVDLALKMTIKSEESESVDIKKLLFFVKEKMEPTLKNVSMLFDFSEGKTSIEKSFLGLIDEIAFVSSNLIEKNNSTFQEFMKLLLEKNILSEKMFVELSANKSETKKELSKQFLVDNDELSNDEINSKIRKIYDLHEGLTKNKSFESEEFSALREKVTQLKNEIDFMRNITETKNYMQFPVRFNDNNSENIEMHVFKRKRDKKDGVFTAVLSLDLAFLGHLDVLIRKQSMERNVVLEFASTKKDTLAFVEANINKLNSYLNDKNYVISSVSFKETLRNVKIEDLPVSNEQTVKTQVKRHTFDMRV